MNKVLCFLLFLINVDAHSQTYIPDNAHSSVTFQIKNLGIVVEGSFTGLSGIIRFNPNQLASSTFEVSVNAASVDTGIELRNKHLRKEDYFDVKTFPQIKFVSTKIETGSEGKFIVTGKLMIKKTIKEIKFDFTASKKDRGYHLVGQFPINRRDYNVGGSSFSMADDLKVFLSVSCIEN